ncbi:MAG: hypothetical protein ABWY65_08740 [Thermoleophilaceae bacterium]
MNKDQRTELFQEYYHLASYVQGYDAHFLLIKSWGITVSAAAIGVGFSTRLVGSTGRIGLFLVAFVLSIAFWVTEVSFKLIQLAHVYRQSSLESSLREDSYIKTPAILHSYCQATALDRQRKRWKAVVFWPHVMLPHVLLAALSLSLLGYQLIEQLIG